MTEAGSVVVADWFAATNDDLLSGYLIANARSAGVLAKLGFQNEAPMMRYSRYFDREVEFQAMRLTKKRWCAIGEST